MTVRHGGGSVTPLEGDISLHIVPDSGTHSVVVFWERSNAEWLRVLFYIANENLQWGDIQEDTHIQHLNNGA